VKKVVSARAELSLDRETDVADNFAVCGRSRSRDGDARRLLKALLGGRIVKLLVKSNLFSLAGHKCIWLGMLQFELLSAHLSDGLIRI